MSKASSGSGMDAVRKRGLSHPNDVGVYGRNGSPTYPSKMGNVGGMKTVPGVGAGASRSFGRRPDEIDRAGVKTSGSVRTDNYTDRGRTWTTGGPSPGRSYAPRSYSDKDGMA
jgi:hypothetical protein